jgi:hypothetical protein
MVRGPWDSIVVAGGLGLAAILVVPAPSPSAAPTPPPTAAPSTSAAPASPPSAAPAPSPSAAPVAPPDDEPGLRRPSRWISTTEPPLARIAEADAAKREVVKKLFADAKVAFPPAQMLLRAFKQEKRLEMWAASSAGAPLSRVATYGICHMSGNLGPKRRQGDQQVPEGFYILDAYNPASDWYLAMQVSYPNLSDRILGDRRDPGNQIMIHGRCASVGCLAMSDDRVQEIWIATTALRWAGGVVHVHIFPARDMVALLASPDYAEQRAFWENLREGLDRFERTHLLFTPRVDADGSYRLPPEPAAGRR